MINRQIRKLLLQDSLSGRLTRTLCGHKNPDALANRCIFLACLPKSGSTYMARLLEAATHRVGLKATCQMGHDEQNIFEPALERCVRKLSVVQQHTQGGDNNVALLAKYRMQPVVLTRNLPDIVLSLLDHIHLHKHTRNPMAFAPGDFLDWSREDQLRWITWAYMPWYFSFYQSWKTNGDKVNAHWVEFSDMIARPTEVVREVLEHMNLPCDLQALEQASDPHNSGKFTRINKGVEGRGAELPPDLLRHLQQLADVWKLNATDRRRLGLT
ncbi:sulfotransferase domain-containing protein [Prosthecobacter sp.]|uniref:sulfotransferase domain-containing protein n=1 Tax=Prosthecobacter sp. TaxID=1965333 RepID=UPI002ABB3859|nr:sulfotransferase domain-containing protein [Prosthecobacter sp.]MDZ4405801.1 sulfotransferase domain-containing protein [Prosthecobacter sp.]